MAKIDTARMEAMKNAIFEKEREVVASKAKQPAARKETMKVQVANQVSLESEQQASIVAPPLLMQLNTDAVPPVAAEDAHEEDDNARSPLVEFDTCTEQRLIAVVAEEIDDESSPSRDLSAVLKDSIAASGSFSRYPQTPRSQPADSIDSLATSTSAFATNAPMRSLSPLPHIDVPGPTEFARNNAIIAWLERREEEDRAEQKRVIHLTKAARAVREADFEIRAGSHALVLRGIGHKIAGMIDDALNHYDMCAEMSVPFVVPRAGAQELPLAPVFVAPDSVQALKSMSMKVSVPTRHSYGAEIEQAVVGGGAQQLEEVLDARWYGAGRPSLGLTQTLSQ
jgi:hypothetical protein